MRNTWNGYCSLSMVVVFLLILPKTYATPAKVNSQAPVTSQKLIVEKQVGQGEYVFSGNCIEAIEPAMDFELHIPMLDGGKPDVEHMRTTGGVQFVVKPGCQPRINVRRVKEQ